MWTQHPDNADNPFCERKQKKKLQHFLKQKLKKIKIFEKKNCISSICLNDCIFMYSYRKIEKNIFFRKIYKIP